MAVLTGAAVMAVVLGACGGGGNDAPTPSPESSVTPTAEAEATVTPDLTPRPIELTSPVAQGDPPEIESFRSFAELIEEAVSDGDGSFFADHAALREVTCAGNEPSGPCAGEAAGAVLQGIDSTVSPNAGNLITLEELAATLEDWFVGELSDESDETGGGAATLYALAYRGSSESVADRYFAVVTGIFDREPDAVRQTRILAYQLIEGEWWLRSDLLIPEPGLAAPWLTGACLACYSFWDPWPGS